MKEIKQEEVLPMTDTPFKNGQKCRQCGSTEWANAHISPKNYCPITCDRCPPKPKESTITPAAQGVE